MTKILRRVSLIIVLDLMTVIGLEQVAPGRVVKVFLSVLRKDIAVAVVGHRVDDGAVYCFCKKLSLRIVGVFGLVSNRFVIRSLIRLGYRGDSFLGVVFIRKRSAVRKGNATDELRRCRRPQLFVFLVLVGDAARVIRELSRDKAAADLKLVEDLSAERVGFTVARHGLAVCCEVYDGGVCVRIVILIGEAILATRLYFLLFQLAFTIVAIEDLRLNGLARDDIAVQSDVTFGRAQELTVTVCISILFLGYDVNTSDDISLSVVGVEKPRTS